MATPKKLPDDMQPLSKKSVTTLAHQVTSQNGLGTDRFFTVGQVTIQSADFLTAAKHMEDGTIQVYNSNELGNFDALSTKGKIVLRRKWAKGNTWASILILVVHEVCHQICGEKYPKADRYEQEAACYTAQYVCARFLKKSFNPNNPILKAADAVAQKVVAGSSYAKEATQLIAALKASPEYMHM